MSTVVHPEHVPEPRSPGREAIAIVGMAGRFPGARTLEQFWRTVRDGVDVLQDFTDAEMAAAGIDETARSRPGWVPRGTVLEEADYFDAPFFGYSPREAQIIDPQQRVFLECAWEALEHAGYASEPPGRTIGVYAGSSINTYILSQLLPDRALVESVGGYQLMLGNDKDFLCTRVSYKLDLHGPSMTIQTACSTSLVAVEVACRALQRGECDMAMAGGVSISFPQRTGYQYQEGMILSPDGVCRPFDADARGTRAGAGAGIVVLKRLSDAIADRDTIHGVVLGAAVNNDGAGKVGYTAPSVDGQMEAIATAHALAGIDPATISYMEAHGTGTSLGDPIEIAALTRVFRASTSLRGFCAIGSLKANLGHLDAAAGVAGLIKTMLVLRHREIPPLPHFRSPNPQLELASSPFRVATAVEPWTAGPRRAGVSSFGIGGTNAHVVVEEAPTPAQSVTHRTHHLIVISARTPEALDASTTNLVGHLSAHPESSLADAAYTLQVGRRAFPHRRAVVARDPAEAADLLSRPDRAPVITGSHEGAPPPVAFLFSGQGSQHAGMVRELYRDEPIVRDAVDRCAEVLLAELGCDLRELLRCATDQQMSETRFTQPLLFAVEYALATLWMSWGVAPAAMLGHSIGEYVAAHLAGVMTLEDALRLVAARGRLMQALPPGDMMAVSLSPEELRRRLGRGVEIAAINAPALCTVSGEPAAIAAFEHELTNAAIEHRRLHTSHAFHSVMMEPALEPFREIAASVRLLPPTRPYISNVTGTWIRPEEATSPQYYVDHLRGAVRFADGVATLAADRSMLLLEVGPGTALSSLARLTLGRDATARVVASQPHPRESRPQIDAMLGAAARLWISGATVDWDGVHRDEQLRRVPLPSYPFERKRYWVEAPRRTSEEAPAGVGRRADVKDWFHVPTWSRVPVADTGRRPLEGAWLVIGDGGALTDRVAERARAAGAEVVVAEEGGAFYLRNDERYTVRATSADDYLDLLRDVRRRGLTPRGILHLWNAGAPTASGDDATHPLHALVALGRALARDPHPVPVRVVVATMGAQSVLGEEVAAPIRALVTGPVLALPAEHGHVQMVTIDLAMPNGDGWAAQAAHAVVDEATVTDRETFVASRAGLRWARRYAESSLTAGDASALPIRQRGVYLITGGLGGIGLTLAEWLATRASARLVLTTRRVVPPRDTWDAWLAAHEPNDPTTTTIAAVRRVEAAGGEVLVATADAADADAMARAVNAAHERWSVVNGVIHSAGLPGGAPVAFSDVAETDAVLSPKVTGTLVLARLLEQTPLDFFVAFSSISAVAGAPGACAYASGCAYLDAYALSSARPRAWKRVQSIAWDAWRDVGMAEQVVVPKAMQAARRAYVAAGIPPRDGAEAFGLALAAGLPQYVVSPYEVDRALQMLRRTGGPSAPVAVAAAQEAARPEPTARPAGSFDAPSGDVEASLATMWEDLLGVSPVGAADNFFDLGGHSLLATRVLARIDDSFGVRLALRAVFEAPTVRQLAALVAAERTGRVAATELAPSGEREEFEL